MVEHGAVRRVLELKVTRKRNKTGKFGGVCPELVNPNNLTVMKWKVCGGKNKCFGYYSVTTFIKYISLGGSLHRG